MICMLIGDNAVLAPHLRAICVPQGCCNIAPMVSLCPCRWPSPLIQVLAVQYVRTALHIHIENQLTRSHVKYARWLASTNPLLRASSGRQCITSAQKIW
jgi:hypothetical protein